MICLQPDIRQIDSRKPHEFQYQRNSTTKDSPLRGNQEVMAIESMKCVAKRVNSSAMWLFVGVLYVLFTTVALMTTENNNVSVQSSVAPSFNNITLCGNGANDLLSLDVMSEDCVLVNGVCNCDQDVNLTSTMASEAYGLDGSTEDTTLGTTYLSEASTEPNTYATNGRQTSLDPANLYQPDDPDIDPYQRATLPYDKLLFSLPPQLTTTSLDYFSDPIYSTETTYTMSDSAVFLDKSVNGSKSLQEYPWPVKREAVVEGDLVIGGLMMVHEREDSITCGPIMPQGGIQALETMLYTIDQINANKLIVLPNITLGAHVLDDCDKDTYGLEMAVDFIKGKFLIS
uniref:Uncharacterized protein LOC114331274 n=1 Tax=Diabrotica virgifera virgifera TaxID=50390 RepID=A0A6P7FKC2_DIAVI